MTAVQYLLVIAAVLLVVLIGAFVVVLVLQGRDASSSGEMSGSGGIDVGLGRSGVEDVHGFRGVSPPTVLQNGTVSVILEESITHAQFCAEVNHPKIIGRNIAGHGEINDISVSSSQYISRQHCRIYFSNGFVWIENLSKIGTVKNGTGINAPEPLKTGDVLLLGDVQLRVLQLII